MDAGRLRLFIYYRLAEAQVSAAAAAVRQAQQALCERHPGLTAGLLQRPEPSPAGDRTLMETYVVEAGARPQGVDAALQAEIESSLRPALHPWLGEGARHSELFEDF